MRWRGLIGWLCWGIVTGASGAFLIFRAQTVSLESNEPYLVFMNIHLASLGLGVLAFLATGFVAAFSGSRWPYWWFLSVILTVTGWAAVSNQLGEIEFVRTPPCCGMHSTDPGSGCDCPHGMKENFTLAELREYYRAKRS